MSIMRFQLVFLVFCGLVFAEQNVDRSRYYNPTLEDLGGAGSASSYLWCLGQMQKIRRFRQPNGNDVSCRAKRMSGGKMEVLGACEFSPLGHRSISSAESGAWTSESGKTRQEPFLSDEIISEAEVISSEEFASKREERWKHGIDPKAAYEKGLNSFLKNCDISKEIFKSIQAKAQETDTGHNYKDFDHGVTILNKGGVLNDGFEAQCSVVKSDGSQVAASLHSLAFYSKPLPSWDIPIGVEAMKSTLQFCKKALNDNTKVSSALGLAISKLRCTSSERSEGCPPKAESSSGKAATSATSAD